MKATDLMIGDWVNGWDGRWHPVCVSTISSYPEHRPTIVACGGYGYSLVDQVNPIPLTPEILEKNGFVKEEFKESPYVDWYKLVYSAYPNKETELVEVNIVKENNEIVGIACAKMMLTNQRLLRIEKYREMNIYVHELQHALRLCGIDKEIVL